MHPKYPNVFSPIRIGPVEVRNRFYSAPHPAGANHAGRPTEDYIQYLTRRAEGGCGLLLLSMAAHERGRTTHASIYPKENVPAFRALTEAVHEAGARIFGQPFYHWSSNGSWQPLSPGPPAIGPSASQYAYHERRYTTREMSKADIREMVAAHRQSATHLREAGFDGVMLHVTHGALHEQFLSPYFNRRTDEYGGSLENRLRFLEETLEAVRDATRGEMAVGMRFNCDELTPGGYDAAEARAALTRLSKSGLIDFVDLDIAVEPQQVHIGMPSVFVEPHLYRPYVEAVRDAARDIPVLSVLGRLTSVADAEDALEAGVCDLVGAARALLAEPDLVRNAFEGREARSRTCIACNVCMSKMHEGAMLCPINPASYRERVWSGQDMEPAPKRSRVVVVGAGPGGLEAARVSALRGHDVTLFEAQEHLGGALALWARLPGREFYANAVAWWERELVRLGVDVRRGAAVTAKDVLSEAPDAVILATGSRYSRGGRSHFLDRTIPGHEQPLVHTPEDVLLGGLRTRGKVVVLDGEGLHAGVGVAELLAGDGAEVECLSPFLAPLSPRLSGTQDAPFIMTRLRSAGVKLTTTTYLKRIGHRQVTAYDIYSGEERVIDDLDAVILATGRLQENGLEAELDGKVAQLFTIGDALAVRMWGTASFEGHKFARLIGELGAPRSFSELYFGPDDACFTPVAARASMAER